VALADAGAFGEVLHDEYYFSYMLELIGMGFGVFGLGKFRLFVLAAVFETW
jgi:hypothetical protein